MLQMHVFFCMDSSHWLCFANYNIPAAGNRAWYTGSAQSTCMNEWMSEWMNEWSCNKHLWARDTTVCPDYADPCWDARVHPFLLVRTLGVGWFPTRWGGQAKGSLLIPSLFKLWCFPSLGIFNSIEQEWVQEHYFSYSSVPTTKNSSWVLPRCGKSGFNDSSQFSLLIAQENGL